MKQLGAFTVTTGFSRLHREAKYLQCLRGRGHGKHLSSGPPHCVDGDTGMTCAQQKVLWNNRKRLSLLQRTMLEKKDSLTAELHTQVTVNVGVGILY